jgi:hypothetical protein
MKMQQATAIGRRALGKYGNMFALRQNFGDLGIDDPRVPTAPPAQEYGIVPDRQATDQRPVPNLFLGHKSRRQNGIDHQNIKPGNVVCHQQNTGGNVGKISLQFDAKDLEQRGRPTGPEAQARRIAKEREEREGERNPTQQ